jgi:hypothetical protein
MAAAVPKAKIKGSERVVSTLATTRSRPRTNGFKGVNAVAPAVIINATCIEKVNVNHIEVKETNSGFVSLSMISHNVVYITR